MNARLALQQIAARALAQRDLDTPGAADVLDGADELHHDRPQLLISGQIQRAGGGEQLRQAVVTRA